MRPSIWSFVRIDQTCLGRSGGLPPGTRLSAAPATTFTCYIAILLGWVRGEEHVPPREALELRAKPDISGASISKRAVAFDPKLGISHEASGRIQFRPTTAARHRHSFGGPDASRVDTSVRGDIVDLAARSTDIPELPVA